jgi:hypothetical protein
MPGAGGDLPQPASHSKPRTAPDTDFLKPVIGLFFPSERKQICVRKQN